MVGDGWDEAVPVSKIKPADDGWGSAVPISKLKPVADKRTYLQQAGDEAGDLVKGSISAAATIPMAVLEGMGNFARGMVAKPVGDVAGLAAIPASEYARQSGYSNLADTLDPTKVREKTMSAIAGAPPTSGVGKAVANYNPLALIGKGLEYGAEKLTPSPETLRDKVGTDNPYVSAEAQSAGIKEALMQLAPIGIAKGLPPAIRATSDAASKAKDAIGGAVDTLTGKKAAQASDSIMGDITGKLSNVVNDTAPTSLIVDDIARQKQNAAQLEEKHAKVQSQIEDLQKTPDFDYAKQGAGIRGMANQFFDNYKTRRSEKAAKDFNESKVAASKLEGEGKYVNTAPVTAPLGEMLKLTEDLPAVDTGVKNLLRSIAGRPKNEVAPPESSNFVDLQGKPLFSKSAETQPKSFDQLVLADRYLRDVAYGADMEGYSGIVRRAAKDAHEALSKQLTEFNPAYKKASDTYAEYSRPLDVMGTKFGQYLTAVDDSGRYSKVADSEIPSKIFKNNEGVKQLKEALSGGVDATDATRAAADATVDKMVESWVLESVRNKSTGKARLGFVNNPNVAAMLGETPGAATRLQGRFGNQNALEQRAATIKQQTKDFPPTIAASEKQLADLTTAKNDIKTTVDMANAKYSQGSNKLKQEALGLYKTAWDNAKKSGQIDQETYNSGLELFNKKATVDEKAAWMQKVLTRVGMTGAVATGVLGYSAVQGDHK